ncbi:MAG: sensor histidine kinase [Gaiellaceae bacterium]
MIRRLSLRARLILGVIALATVGLLVADVATYGSLRTFLVSRTDASLDSAARAVDRSFEGPRGFGSPPGTIGQGPRRGDGDDGRRPPFGGPRDIGRLTAAVPGIFVQLRNADGTVEVGGGGLTRFSGEKQEPPPALARTTALETWQTGTVKYLTVPATKGDGRWRVRISGVPGSQEILVLGSSLGDVDSTLNRLVLIEGLVTVAVLAGIILLGLWVIRAGLRPLDEIGATAATIAAGDLSHRVAREDDTTEVGRLGKALNAMLAQIESAFQAREASERKLRRFVADASHELRTPLAAVRAYAELFSRGAAQRPDDLERSMAGISRESERMSVLVDDLLLLARLDEGRPLVREELELENVVAESVETARALEPGRAIRSSLEEATVVGDRDRLRQVVDNLLANVRAHADPDASVDVTLRRNGANVRLTVADSGPGLTEEQAEHVFERFYRADESRARTAGGAGLGLSIVAAVTGAHGGRVSAAPAPEGGAVFTVELPLAPAS